MSQASLVMTVIGRDQPGLVERLARAIADHGGNWLESRMAHLGGQFAGIVRVQLPADRVDKLLAALGKLEAEGLTVHSEQDTAPATTAEQSLCTIELVGHDRPGIIRQISEVLARHHVNVEELITDCESAAMSGEMLFRAVARVRLPSSLTIAELRDALEQIAGDLMVDINIKV